MTQLDLPRSRPPERRALFRSRIAVLGASILAVMFVACIVTLPYTLGAARSVDAQNPPPRYDVQELDAILLPPSWAPHTPAEEERLERFLEARASNTDAGAEDPFFPLGTDTLGRDFFIRCLVGGGVSLGIGLAAAAISVLIGTVYGMLAGFLGGRVDAAMMRVVDVLYGLPYILLVVLLAVALDGVVTQLEIVSNRVEEIAVMPAAEASAALEDDSWWVRANYAMPGPVRGVTRFANGHQSLINFVILLIAIGGVSWLTMARVIRGQVLSLKNQPFMEACRAIGVPTRQQFTKHLLPNLLGPIIVYATLTVPQAILQESFLSFLGIGIQPPLPSWGNLAAEGLSQLNPVESRWWLLLWPCVLLGVTLLALNFVGEGLREVFDPRRRTAAD
ncbi:MAG: ABC transporter permease [Phycisphaerales bacterium]